MLFVEDYRKSFRLPIAVRQESERIGAHLLRTLDETHVALERVGYILMKMADPIIVWRTAYLATQGVNAVITAHDLSSTSFSDVNACCTCLNVRINDCADITKYVSHHRKVDGYWVQCDILDDSHIYVKWHTYNLNRETKDGAIFDIDGINSLFTNKKARSSGL